MNSGILLAAAALFAEAGAAWFLIVDEVEWLLLFHGLGSAAFACSIVALAGGRYRENRTVAGAFAFGFALSMPVCGPMIVLVLLLLDRRIKPRLRQDEAFLAGDPLDGVPHIPGDVKKVDRSIISVLNSSDVAARRNAIMALRAISEPSLVDVLNKAVRDSDEHVRSYAQSRLQKLIEGMEAETRHLRKTAEENPGNPGILLALAEQMFETVYMGLASAENERMVLAEVVRSLEECMRLSPRDGEALFLAMRCYLRLNRWEEAERCHAQLSMLGYRSSVLEWWHFETLYEKRNWSEFYGEMDEAARAFPSGAIQSLDEFWRPPAAREAS
ncbi:MAG: HEAT repeat domain-containing protein [Verrucomicrobiae bacterium]|nr:HEAT repeat domain-containing protein [Verrucomicrobiae bacterium]